MRHTLEELKETLVQARREIGKVIIGQTEVVDRCLIAIFTGNHALIEGVPGVAKTLLVRTLAHVLGCDFARIQFTPDLMPADITGSEVMEEDPVTRRRDFRFIRGPVFANVILADEINRTPPKTQAALLQAMQEKQVTAAGHTHALEAPFFVLATQNPIEQEGTYPLPEAQLDRFMFNVLIGYPDLAEEIRIVESTTGVAGTGPSTVISRQQVLAFQEVVREVPLQEEVTRYAVRLVRATRVGTGEAAAAAREFLAWGAGPRAAQDLIRGAKTRALLDGRETPAREDLRRLAHPVLRHRLVTNFHAEAESMAKDTIIDRILAEVGE
jgi:MoxR-like ATPase